MNISARESPPTPLVSIIVPAYNAERTIAATLESLLAQSCPPREILVVDDGSKDRTREVLAPFADRVRLIFQANGGVSAARNEGVRQSRGEWLAFCDADDIWHRAKLQIIERAIAARPDVDLVFHDFWTIVRGEVDEAKATHSKGTMFPLFRENRIRIPEVLPEQGRLDSGTDEFGIVDTWSGNAFRWLILGNFLMPSTVAIRRAAFDEVGGFDANFRYAEDTEFFLRFGKGHRFSWIDCSLTGYRREPGTLLTGSMLPTLRNATRAVVRHCVEDRTVYEGPESAWVHRAVSRRFTRLAYYCLTELNGREAREWARTALSHHRTNLQAWSILAGSMVPPSVLRLGRRLKRATS